MHKIESLHQTEGYDVVITDIIWEDITSRPKQESRYFGITALKYIKRRNPKCKVILMFKHSFDLDRLEEISKADAYFKLDCSPSQILKVVDDILSSDTQKRFDDDNHNYLIMDKGEINIRIPVRKILIFIRIY